MNLDVAVTIAAGLGLFIIGVKGVASSMGQLAGQRLREWVARSTGRYGRGALIGLFSGALTQSTNAITIILMSLVKADLITIANARPILTWANVGTVSLAVMAAIDIHLFVLALVGLAGICFYLNLDRSPRWRLLVTALFSFSMLFLGLELMREGSHQLKNLEWIADLFTLSAQWMVSGFIVGAVLAAFTQSSATVTVIAMAMSSAGLLTLEQVMTTVCGASLGSGLSTFFVASGMTGRAGQLAVMQTATKALGVAVLMPLLIIEHVYGVPLVIHAIRMLSADPNRQVVLIYFIVQITAVVAQEMTRGWLQSMVEMLSPPSLQESLASPRFLYPQSLGDPETALALVDREQQRVFSLVPLYLSITDHWDAKDPVPAFETVHPIAQTLSATIDEFLRDLADSGAGRSTLEAVANRQARNGILMSIHDALQELSHSLRGRQGNSAMKDLTANLSEGLGALLLTAEEAVRSQDPDDLAILHRLTADRDSLVDSMRQRAMAADRSLSADDQRMLYTITNLFERTVWLLRRYSALLTPKAQPAATFTELYEAPESRATASS